ncbi:hypothetical protein E4U59_007528 [Claviceps monticola]|nr:hypothetical protein E4U59_007528 [Claviceps monticola]
MQPLQRHDQLQGRRSSHIQSRVLWKTRRRLREQERDIDEGGQPQTTIPDNNMRDFGPWIREAVRTAQEPEREPQPCHATELCTHRRRMSPRSSDIQHCTVDRGAMFCDERVDVLSRRTGWLLAVLAGKTGP